MYTCTKETLSSMAKAVLKSVSVHGTEIKHSQILNALSEGLGEKSWQVLSSKLKSCTKSPLKKQAKIVKSLKTYHLKITLKHSRPVIWRTIKISSLSSLQDLHHAIQTSMGWYNCHLHQFRSEGLIYGVNYEDGWGDPVIDESQTKICDVLCKINGRLDYEYDFGDCWEHTITLLEITDENIMTTICTDGKHNCPPEDIGGISGFKDFLEIIKNPKHPEYDEWLEWNGGVYDPSKFDIKNINKKLAVSV